MTEHAPVIDEIEARPGSTASLLRTLIGLYLRRVGGWISTADLVEMASVVGISAPSARTGIARLKQKGVLLADRSDGIGYRVNPAAIGMLERGDRRIFTIRQMTESDAWCLVSFTVPEERRPLRHQLRRRLQWIGCGVVAPGLWICPGYLEDEVEEILSDLGLRDTAVVFRAEAPRTAGPLADAVTQWWDLDALRIEHEQFLAALDSLDEPTDPESTFRNYVHLIDAWRVLPYVDPGLPAGLLPSDWPGAASFAEFRERSARWEAGAWDYVRSVLPPT